MYLAALLWQQQCPESIQNIYLLFMISVTLEKASSPQRQLWGIRWMSTRFNVVWACLSLRVIQQQNSHFKKKNYNLKEESWKHTLKTVSESGKNNGISLRERGIFFRVIKSNACFTVTVVWKTNICYIVLSHFECFLVSFFSPHCCKISFLVIVH